MNTRCLVPIGLLAVIVVSGCTGIQTKVCEGSGVKVNITDTCPQYWCGDGSCLLGVENCSSCPQDCGTCPPDKLSKFDVAGITCDNVLSEFGFTLKNTYYEMITVRQVSISMLGGEPNGRMQYSTDVLPSGGDKSYMFPATPCVKGGSFSIEVLYTDTNGSHSDIGAKYEIP